LGLVYPHLGLCYLSAYLKKHLPGRLEINYIGFHALEFGILRRIIDNRPDVIGFTSDTANINLIFEIARRIKRVRDVPLLLGGPHITSLPRGLSSHIDIGIVGEGEETFLELIKMFLENKRFDADLLYNVNGICFHRDSQVCVTAPRQEIKDIDSLPYPDRAILKLGNRLNLPYLFYPAEKERGTSLITSRGCPCHCIFCYTPNAFKQKVLFHSIERVMEEIERIVKRGIKKIWFADPSFSFHLERVDQLMEKILEKNFKVEIWLETRADLINTEVLKKMNRAGVKQVAYGLESASEKVLSSLKKKISLDQIRRAIELTHQQGIDVELFTQFGLPLETFEDAMMTLEFLKDNQVPIRGNSNSQQTQIYFGTELQHHHKKYG
jgi:radical SAM superfamily enzyme YgiQ (UPF0313 family)